MKLLNLHGYQASAENAAFLALKKCGYEVVSPQLDYDKSPPDLLRHELLLLFQNEQCDAVVGSSMGGYFAAQLCAMTQCRAVLINPCMLPFVTLPKYGNIRPEWIMLYFDLTQTLRAADPERLYVILGEMDEVIEYHPFTRSFFGEERCLRVPDGKHSGATLPLETLFTEFGEKFFH